MGHLLHERDHVRVTLAIGEVAGHVRLVEPGDEPVDQPQRGGHHEPVAVAVVVDLVAAAPVQAALALRDRRRPAAAVREEPLHQQLLGVGDQRLVPGEVDVRPLARRVAQAHPGERAAGRVEPDDVRRLVAVAVQRRRLRRARDRGGPAERVGHEVVHGQPRPRPLAPHRRHREPHEPRERCPQGLVVEGRVPAPPVLDQEVGVGEQGAALVAGGVERDDALPRVVPGLLDGDAAVAEEGRLARELVALRRCDAHDIGAAVGEQPSGEGARPACLLDDAEPGQRGARARHGAKSYGAIPQCARAALPAPGRGRGRSGRAGPGTPRLFR